MRSKTEYNLCSVTMCVKGFLIYKFPRGYTFASHSGDVLIEDRTIWCFRDFEERNCNRSDYRYAMNPSRMVTRFEILPAFLAARTSGTLKGPKDLEDMLDNQLHVLKTHRGTLAGEDVAELIAGSLLKLTENRSIDMLPEDEGLIFPKLYSSMHNCLDRGCTNEPFRCYYYPRTQLCHPVTLTREIMDWCMWSFEWELTISIGARKCPRILLRHELHKDDMPMFMTRGELAIWSISRGIEKLHGCGNGLPKEDTVFLQYILRSISRTLQIPVRPTRSQPCTGYIQYRLGPERYYSKYCSLCTLRKTESGSTYNVELLPSE